MVTSSWIVVRVAMCCSMFLFISFVRLASPTCARVDGVVGDLILHSSLLVLPLLELSTSKWFCKILSLVYRISAKLKDGGLTGCVIDFL